MASGESGGSSVPEDAGGAVARDEQSRGDSSNLAVPGVLRTQFDSVDRARRTLGLLAVLTLFAAIWFVQLDPVAIGDAPWSEGRSSALTAASLVFLWVGVVYLVLRWWAWDAPPLPGAESPFAIVLCDAVILAVLIGVVARRPVVVTPSLRELGLDGMKALAPFAGLGAMALIMFSFGWLTERLAVPFERWFDIFIENGWPLWSAVALLTVTPAVIEELSFRGVIQGELGHVLGPNESNIVQAAMFAIVHYSDLALISHFGLGLVFGYLRRATGSLYAGMIVHAAWNGCAGLAELGVVGSIAW